MQEHQRMKAWTLAEIEQKHRLQWAHEVPGNSCNHTLYMHTKIFNLQVIFISCGSAFGYCSTSSGELLLILAHSAT